ncbi:MAG: aminodeoxychorismate lyase [Ponticaulis sp.]|nr:aminodeoxychorismate lyase [Ponticaulis sp.]|tara:strand:- start:39906 stop:40946 length:1041 start_codon:yes stop_codon:yes gene_type:complete
MKWVVRLFVVFLVCCFLLAGAGFGAFKWFEGKISEPGPLAGGEDRIVFVERGAGVIKVGQQLEDKGLISDARLFRLAARYKELESDIKAGEYLIDTDSSMVDILRKMNEGDVILHQVQIIEGSTIAQAWKVIEETDFLKGEMPELLPEGSFLPETHAFSRGTTRTEVVEAFANYQTQLLDEIWPARQEDLPIESREEAVILASIIEKETGGLGDEDLVAGVFINRLNRGMRLQSDPTIIYGISKGVPLTRTLSDGRVVRRTLYRSEIDRVTDYNTYQIDGLPPTPICNPSEAALRAVLQPAESDYLFFVADGTGGHAFAKTNSEHNRNVARWREIERARIAAQRGE